MSLYRPYLCLGVFSGCRFIWHPLFFLSLLQLFTLFTQIFYIMATINQGILSGFSGAIGSVTGAKSKGKDTMRTRVTKPKNPKTEKQIISRQIFALMQSNPKVFHGGSVPDHLFSLNTKQGIKAFQMASLKSFYNKTDFFTNVSIGSPKYKDDIFNVFLQDPNDPTSSWYLSPNLTQNSVSGNSTDILIECYYDLVTNEIYYENIGLRSGDQGDYPLGNKTEKLFVSGFIAFYCFFSSDYDFQFNVLSTNSIDYNL